MDRPTTARALSIDLTAEPPFRIGAAEVFPLSRDARAGDHCERLQPQTLKVLLLLARHRGDVVTREELIECIWDGRFVGDDVINRSISQLRQFAGRVEGFRIETVPRVGYRLVEQVDRPGSGRRWWISGAVAALLAIVAIALLLPGAPRFLQGKPSVPSVAVLPMTTPSNDPLLRGIAQGLRDALSHDLANSGL